MKIDLNFLFEKEMFLRAGPLKQEIDRFSLFDLVIFSSELLDHPFSFLEIEIKLASCDYRT